LLSSMENRRSIAAIRSQVLQQPAGFPNKEGTGKPSFMFLCFWKRFVTCEPGLQLERERERERERALTMDGCCWQWVFPVFGTE